MTEPQIPLDNTRADWARRVASAINRATARVPFPFVRLKDAPPSPAEGQAYYDTTIHKARVYDGTAWRDLW